MTHPALMLFDNDLGNGLWMFLSVGAVALFAVLVPLVIWIENRRKEREAFYKSETLRRLSESSGDGAKMALEMLREGSRQEQIKMREGLKIGGLVCVAAGVGLIVFLRTLIGGGHDSPYLCGLIPGLIGVAMLVYVYLMAAPVE